MLKQTQGLLKPQGFDGPYTKMVCPALNGILWVHSFFLFYGLACLAMGNIAVSFYHSWRKK
jgi:hypothetical protein